MRSVQITGSVHKGRGFLFFLREFAFCFQDSANLAEFLNVLERSFAAHAVDKIENLTNDFTCLSILNLHHGEKMIL